MSTGLSKFGACGIESRQKTREMSLFCLPDSPNSGRAASKVDKKRDKCLIFVYRTLQIQSSPNLCVKYFSQAQVVQGMRMHPCLSTITLEGAVKGAPSAHLEEVPLTASERVIHLTQLLVFVVPLPILLVQQPS